MKNPKISVINGANLNLLGKREPEIYGVVSLEEINQNLKDTFKNVQFDFFQSNHEGKIVDYIGEIKPDVIIINPGAFTHTSVAIRDALLAVNVPVIEVHISNIFAREEFRKHSFMSDICQGMITGFGIKSYEIAVFAWLTSQKVLKNS